jgi:hypothetical protein
VPAHVEQRIIFPAWSTGIKGHANDALAVARHEMDFRFDALDEAIVRDLALEDSGGANVERRLVALKKQKGCVFRPEAPAELAGQARSECRHACGLGRLMAGMGSHRTLTSFVCHYK